MSSIFIYPNYFKPVETTTSLDQFDDSDEFLLIDTVEQVAQPSIQALTQSKKQLTPLSSQPDLELSTSGPSSSQVLTAPASSASSSSSSESATLPSKPYIFKRTSSWKTIQDGDDKELRIEGPDSDGDVLIVYRGRSLSISTSDKGTYVIQVHSQKIDVQFNL